jgi:hypothetical protein
MLFAAIFSIIIGVGMIAQWSLFYFSKQIPELETEPIRIGFHIVSEMVTAVLLIFGGIGLLTQLAFGRDVYLISMGMLFYTAIISPGYFAQKGQWAWMAMFLVILILGLFGVILI